MSLTLGDCCVDNSAAAQAPAGTEEEEKNPFKSSRATTLRDQVRFWSMVHLTGAGLLCFSLMK